MVYTHNDTNNSKNEMIHLGRINCMGHTLLIMKNKQGYYL